MKTKLKIRIFLESSFFKMASITLLVILILSAILLPSILTSRPKDSVLAFNRDATSGTREAFVEKVIEPEDWDSDANGKFKEVWSPGKNVREVRNNDAMITFVQRELNSVGYVSFGTVAEFDEDGNPVKRTDRNGMDKIEFATFENVMPTRDAVLGGDYSAARNFNMFFRVFEGSDEQMITNYDWEANTIDEASIDAVDSTDNSNDLKAAYFFFNWVTHSTEAAEIIDESGELSFSTIDTREDWMGEGVVVDENGNIISADLSSSEKFTTYIDNTGVNDESNILIEIVGSTSATALMTDLTNFFDEALTTAYGWSDDKLQFVIATNGSGDAVSKSAPAGTDHPFIGMQSKDQDKEGLDEWGTSYANEDGTYDSTVYTPFAKDAILIIYNSRNIQEWFPELSVEDGDMLNTNQEELYELYTNNEYLTYEDLFQPYTTKVGDNNA